MKPKRRIHANDSTSTNPPQSQKPLGRAGEHQRIPSPLRIVCYHGRPRKIFASVKFSGSTAARLYAAAHAAGCTLRQLFIRILQEKLLGRHSAGTVRRPA